MIIETYFDQVTPLLPVYVLVLSQVTLVLKVLAYQASTNPAVYINNFTTTLPAANATQIWFSVNQNSLFIRYSDN
jgi:hypothetical protein